MRKVIHYVNGILTFPGSSKNWNGRAVTHTHTRSGYRAEKVEYWCGPVSRAFGQYERADKLSRTVVLYDGDWEQSLVGHSNGADVILTAIRKFPFRIMQHVHLVCGACNADFNVNGLNRMLTEGMVGGVTVYVAGKDRALALAHTIAGRLLGYGTLGLHGALNILPSINHRVKTVTWPEYGHSDCWADSEFESTMKHFL